MRTLPIPRTLLLAAAAWLSLASPRTARGQGGPSVEEFKRALDAALQRLRPMGFTQRTLLFESVRPGAPSGAFYPFTVTATLHDYGPGYPANRYYGQTCVGRMDGWKFDMRRGDGGEWVVQGRLTVTGRDCKDNPSAGTSATPLSSLPGTPVAAAGAGQAAGAPGGARPGEAPAGNLYVGEYACYGTGGRPLAGMGFRLQSGGRYVDTDNARGGTYVYDAAGATITFRGGFLDGQSGRNVRATGFALSSTVSCEPWR